MTDSFTNVFGGSAVSPADVAFAAYTFSSDLTLYWPQFANGQPNIAARFMNLTASVNTSLNVFMPDATLVSTGYDVIIFNKGSYTFNVVDSQGGAIATIASGQTFYLLLTDNSTTAGTWQTVQFGVGTGSASAAALAGAGLLAVAGLLNTNTDVDLQSIDYSITDLSRARLQVWNGGAGTITLPTAASVGDGFFFSLANNGSGSVTVTPSGGDQIDGASTSVFTQTQSAFIVTSGTAWYSVGKGLQNNFSVTLLNLNVAGSSDVVETSAQAQNVIQQYTGILTGNINVVVPNTVQLYYVFNDTSGPYTLTIKTAAGTGFLVPQGEHVIVYCDGTNVLSGFSTTIQVVGTPTYSIGVAGGTANALTGNASNFVLQLGTVVWLTPALLNTGPTTLNVQSTGTIAVKKVAPTGLVDLSANDFVPGLVNVVYYNGTYWISVNTIYEGLYQTLSGDATMSFAYFLNSVDVTTAVNLTLPITTSFPSYFYTTLFADGGAITLIPDAGDTIQGGSAGVNYVIPQGSSARLATNAAGKWTLFLLTGGASTSSTITDDTATNATMYPTWVTANTGNLPLKVSSTKLSFNPSTATLTVANITGNASTATTATNVTVANEGTDTTCFPTFVTAATGNLPPKSNAALTYNSNTGALGSTTFVGALTGNASTATKLATGRTIAITGDLAYTSPSFDGSGNVTAAGTLATVNSNVGSFTNSSITVNAKGLITAASSGTAPAVAYNSIAGCLPTSIAGTSTTASITITSGQVANSANTAYITSAGYSWAASNGNAINGTDAASSTLANSTTYHFFLCSGGSGTGTFASASLTPTFPAGYTTSSRRIFSLNTNSSGALLPGTAIETAGGAMTFYLTTQTLDVSVTNLSTSRTLYTLTVPSGIKVQALTRASTESNVLNSTTILTSPDETDVAPTAYTTGSAYTAAPGFDMQSSSGAAFANKGTLLSSMFLTTNTSGQIGARASAASTVLDIVTRGFIDYRRA